MADQMIFKRCEIKYMLDITQAELLKNQMKQYMTADEHGRVQLAVSTLIHRTIC